MAERTEWLQTDYYRVLDLAESASAKEITKGVPETGPPVPPDANPGDIVAEDRFNAVSAAYDVIGDPAKRAEYGELRRLGPAAAGLSARRGPVRVRVDHIGDFGHFGDPGSVCGDGFDGGWSMSAGQPRRGGDLDAELSLSFKEAARGVTTLVEFTGPATCDACRGCGRRAGAGTRRCQACSGRGRCAGGGGVFSTPGRCQVCAGRGCLSDACTSCGGSGTVRALRQVRVRVPAGIDDGQVVRLAGRGAPSCDGGPPGDLFVVVRVAPHPLFGRRGADLTLNLPVTYPEAVLGAEITVPALDEGRVTVRVPPGTPSGRVLRVRGTGPARPDGPGDLLVTVEVVVPGQVSDQEARAVEAPAQSMEPAPGRDLRAG